MQWLISKQVQRSLGSGSIKTGLHIQSSPAEAGVREDLFDTYFPKPFVELLLVSYCLGGGEELSPRGLSPPLGRL